MNQKGDSKKSINIVRQYSLIRTSEEKWQGPNCISPVTSAAAAEVV